MHPCGLAGQALAQRANAAHARLVANAAQRIEPGDRIGRLARGRQFLRLADSRRDLRLGLVPETRNGRPPPLEQELLELGRQFAVRCDGRVVIAGLRRLDRPLLHRGERSLGRAGLHRREDGPRRALRNGVGHLSDRAAELANSLPVRVGMSLRPFLNRGQQVLVARLHDRCRRRLPGLHRLRTRPGVVLLLRDEQRHKRDHNKDRRNHAGDGHPLRPLATMRPALSRRGGPKLGEVRRVRGHSPRQNALDVIDQLLRARVSLVAFLCHCFPDDSGRAFGQLGAGVAKVRRRLGQVLRHHLGLRAAAIRRQPGEQVIQHRAERIDVGPSVELGLAAHLLGRYVVGRAERRPDLRHAAVGALGLARQPEVRQLDRAVGRDENVVRLHVAVDQPGLVRAIERAGNIARDLEGVPLRELAFRRQDVPQRVAVDELHREVVVAVGLAGVDPLDDVDVVELGRGMGLAQEAREVILILRGSTFRATIRSTETCRALKTAPIAPWPSFAMISNPPMVRFWSVFVELPA